MSQVPYGLRYAAQIKKRILDDTSRITSPLNLYITKDIILSDMTIIITCYSSFAPDLIISVVCIVPCKTVKSSVLLTS